MGGDGLDHIGGYSLVLVAVVEEEDVVFVVPCPLNLAPVPPVEGQI